MGEVQAETLVKTIELNTTAEDQSLPLRHREENSDEDDFITIRHVIENIYSLKDIDKLTWDHVTQ